jgi:hypothetical protein
VAKPSSGHIALGGFVFPIVGVVIPTLIGWGMCNLYSITTNQAAIVALFRVVNRYVGNLPPTPGVFPDYPAPVIRDAGQGPELVTMR